MLFSKLGQSSNVIIANYVLLRRELEILLLEHPQIIRPFKESAIMIP